MLVSGIFRIKRTAIMSCLSTIILRWNKKLLVSKRMNKQKQVIMMDLVPKTVSSFVTIQPRNGNHLFGIYRYAHMVIGNRNQVPNRKILLSLRTFLLRFLNLVDDDIVENLGIVTKINYVVLTLWSVVPHVKYL